MNGPVRLAVVASKFPYGTKEAYLGTDLDVLAGSAGALFVWPVSPDLSATRRPTPAAVEPLPLLGAATLKLALREVARHPTLVAKVALLLACDDTPLRVRLKNFAVFPKALALAQRARAENVEHIHAYWLSTPATVASVVSRLTGIPWSATAHRWDIYEGNMIRTKLGTASFVRTISERGRADLTARAPEYASRIRTVRVGVAVPERAADPPGRPGTLRLLCAANLVPVKGHRFVLEALALARTQAAVSVTFAGEGPLREELESLALRLGVRDAVTFRGHVEHDRLIGETASGAFDAAILASTEDRSGLMEGLPVALIEAMAHGLPCIATDSGSIGELVNADCGIVVPHSNATELSHAMVKLAASPELRRSLGARARARVVEEFDRQTCVAQLVRMIDRTARWDSVPCRVSNEASCVS
jgi:glycosyltransferase involved in cell wall biosynthesis